MPIWLRRFTYKQIQDYFSKINNQDNDDNVQKSINNMKSVGAVKNKSSVEKLTPPTYVNKTPKK